MDQSEIAAAAQEFEAARARGEYFPRSWFDRLTLDDAYRILLALNGRGDGERRIGWKIGLTAPVIQQHSACTSRSSPVCWRKVWSNPARSFGVTR
jgi:2-keto-4-pentenoate hydratase